MPTLPEPDPYEEALAQMLAIAQARWGRWIRSYWFYDQDHCPGCEGRIDAMRIRGRQALSLNTFIYRRRGVLIGYFLCSRCAGAVFMAARKRPDTQTALHMAIEERLIQAYERHIAAAADA
jgi:hypothetical protein